ncbi:MAG: 1-acyl-sn-glycerol-3-phosphate acyltransferase [Alphaproteobacteria bacterium]|nr:1-acyl-sn-glycerol-3-phosphate acyltransferase [Rhodospirillales bacterium]MCW9045699.1 1-acyl-sn-glycerol-3-phosphate acyltransferase [Alphaproteobacteria bacterium]
MTGWKPAGYPPKIDKYVLIVAPHTSNWDFPVGVAFAFIYKMTPIWMGKDALFKFPHGPLFRYLSGVAIDRSQSRNVVASSIRAFEERQALCLTITPEGTRSFTEGWKTGFYHIAEGAKVPVILACMDHKTKTVNFSDPIEATGDIDTDFQKFSEFYAPVEGRRNDKFGPVKIREKKLPQSQ